MKHIVQTAIGTVIGLVLFATIGIGGYYLWSANQYDHYSKQVCKSEFLRQNDFDPAFIDRLETTSLSKVSPSTYVVEVVTPTGVTFSCSVEWLSLPGSEPERYSILVKHTDK